MYIPQILYAIPLIIVFSLVYAGTRHEFPKPILEHAARFGGSVVVFMTLIGLFLEFLVYIRS